jgi:hypothetical protein
MAPGMWERQDVCPRCGVDVREPCKNLHSPGRPMRWPHQERERLREYMTPTERRNHDKRAREGRGLRPAGSGSYLRNRAAS